MKRYASQHSHLASLSLHSSLSTLGPEGWEVAGVRCFPGSSIVEEYGGLTGFFGLSLLCHVSNGLDFRSLGDDLACRRHGGV